MLNVVVTRPMLVPVRCRAVPGRGAAVGLHGRGPAARSGGSGGECAGLGAGRARARTGIGRGGEEMAAARDPAGAPTALPPGRPRAGERRSAARGDRLV